MSDHGYNATTGSFDVFQDCKSNTNWIPENFAIGENFEVYKQPENAVSQPLPSRQMPLSEINNFENNVGFTGAATGFSGVTKGQNCVDRNLKCTSMKKFTCRYDIQIPNESQFRVARKIIGFKGGNMKKIIDDCKLRDPKNKYGVKLRLRGRGSGFKEGPGNCESDDDLHLCVSSQFLDSAGFGVQALFPFQNENVLRAYDVFKLA